jgi:hypothetical protein
MSVHEVLPPPPIRFRSRESLDDHVVRHVLRGRDERWDDVFDPEVLANAREEWEQGCFGANCEQIADEYERIVSGAIVRACQSGQWHYHLAEYVWRPQSSGSKRYVRTATLQTVVAWPPADLLRIVAKAAVRGERMFPYTIRSAFRPWPWLTGNSYVKKSLEWAAERDRLRNDNCQVLETHY